MDSRFAYFLLGALVVAGVSAAGGTCPPGFRCAGTAAGQSCKIEEGPFRGETGVRVDGRCLRSSDAGSGAAHTHVIEPGHCPLCGGEADEFLSFNVQTAAPPASSRRILRCLTCGNLFADVP
ncbi:MAG TPA: hypothetical protein VFO11_08975 [Candidatus Polarisedimenticolaceae bacterium]|nr:hypothetical protein [Candidatus Polarisedimenticolaceae bacterium]